jgi:hypothetical protein
MKTKNYTFVVLLLALLFGGYTSANAAEKTSGLILNEDASHFFFQRPAEKMTIEGLHELVDKYSDGQVSHLFFNVNGMKTSYRSEVWDSIWDDNRPQQLGECEGIFSACKWVKNAWLLHSKGIDPYEVWVKYSKTKGVSPWISIRTNDIHQHDEPEGFHVCIYSSFVKEHPEYRRNPQGTGYFDFALDYGIQEVREYQLSLVKEVIQRYDADGVELDWLRESRIFAPGKEDQGREILTGYMAEVRKLADEKSAKTGRPYQVAVRVPAVPESAYGWGFDVATWVKTGLVDMVTLSARESADYDIPIEQWRQLMGDAADNITLNACMSISIHPSPGGFTLHNNLETMRGFTATMLHRGADNIYLFNHMDGGTSIDSPDEYIDLLRQAGRLETVIDKPRRHVVTYHDLPPPDKAFPIALPAEIDEQKNAVFNINIGPKPTTGRVVVRVGYADSDDEETVKVTCKINSFQCKPSTKYYVSGGFRASFGVAYVDRFMVPLSELKDGDNTVDLVVTNGGAQKITWLEIYIIP